MNTLALSGKVVPTQTAQLVLPGAGAVTAVHVRPGQSVKQGEPLLEFALDYQFLQGAQTRATLAQLAYESEQAKLDQLKAGPDKAPLEQLSATLAKDQAEIQKLELDRDAATNTRDRADQTRAIQKDTAERRVALAQLAVQSAGDNLAAARAAVKRAQDNTQILQARSKNQLDQAQADAQAAVDAAAAASRGAQRRVQEAATRLAQAQLNWNGTKATQEITALKQRVDRDQGAVRDAKAAEQAAQTAAEAAIASAASRAAGRDLAADQLALDQAQANLGAAKLTDEAAIKAASLALEQANDELAQARTNQQRAQERLQRATNDAANPLPTASSDQTDPETLQGRVAEAQHKLDIEKLNLEEAVAARAALDNPDPHAQFATLSIEAAKAQLQADSARLAVLKSGAPGEEIRREERRVSLLRDEATAAAEVAQPVIVLKAPFDATVTSVGVNEGQTVAPQIAPNDGSAMTAPGATAGQTSDGRQVAVRLAGSGTTSIIASASETDVNLLSVGQPVTLSFPGLPGKDASGTIAEIAAAPAVQGSNVTYPVRVDVPNVPPSLKVGMTVQLAADIEEARDVLIAPLDAIRNVSGQALVGKIDGNGIVTDVPVSIGHKTNLNAEIVRGVNEGDVVALYTRANATSPSPTR
jgi:multidrug efflux pump subunit AcrA (membrane-fusion protein)